MANVLLKKSLELFRNDFELPGINLLSYPGT